MFLVSNEASVERKPASAERRNSYSAARLTARHENGGTESTAALSAGLMGAGTAGARADTANARPSEARPSASAPAPPASTTAEMHAARAATRRAGVISRSTPPRSRRMPSLSPDESLGRD